MRAHAVTQPHTSRPSENPSRPARLPISARMPALPGAVPRVLAGLLSIAAAQPAAAQKVFFGVADQWQPLLAQSSAWPFVQKNADGFYVNFIMMNRVIRHAGGMSDATLQQTCALFATHAVYLESDIRAPLPGQTGSGAGGRNDGASAAQDATYIHLLHQAGCKIDYTSLNGGWNDDRAHNLTGAELSEPLRLDFVQTGPWTLNGDILGGSARGRPGYNEKLRDWIAQSDGVSTDGPLGFWAADHGDFRDGEISLVRYAHRLHKQAAVMLAPYAAGQTDVYEPRRDLLATGQDEVRTLEAKRAVPDIYMVFEYATDIPPTPEQVDGKPVNTMAGLAFWLIHHIHDPAHWAALEWPGQGGLPAEPSFDASLVNRSTWLDLAPLLRLRLANAAAGLTVRLMLNGQDVTQAAASPQGLALTGPLTLSPGTRRGLSLSASRAGVPVALHMASGAGPAAAHEADLELTLAPNPGVPAEIHQRLAFRLSPES